MKRPSRGPAPPMEVRYAQCLEGKRSVCAWKRSAHRVESQVREKAI